MSDPIYAQAGGGRPRPHLMLAGLTLFYTSSFVDRSIINIVAEAIKHDLGLTDTELGILGGIAFAALYAILGIPIARLAERKNRLFIITIALTIWSVMTMLCAGVANFWQFALARAGVGIGEAACTPCAHSMIGDSFPADRRATALSIYSLGIPLGTLVGILGGAWVAEAYSWRAAFVAVGAPGLILALAAALLLKEPVRGRFDPPVNEVPPAFSSVLRHLWSRSSFRYMLAGVSLSTMISAGHAAFLAPFLLRSSFGVDLSDVALILGATAGCAAFVGTLTGGPLADRLSRRDERLMLRVPAFAYLVAAPAFAFAFASHDLSLFVIFALIGQVGQTIYLGPTFGALHNMVEPRMRATAVAIVFMLCSLVGIGLGPVLAGVISDFATVTFYSGASVSCVPSASIVCPDASFAGLRAAMITLSILYLIPAVLYYLAGSKLKESLLRAEPVAT